EREIEALMRGSSGLNLALDYLPGAVTFDPVAEQTDAALASAVVWFDAYVTNVDRTPRNTNMLIWHRRLWLIDHGAALYFHHTWTDYRERSRAPFPMIKDHVLLQFAHSLQEVDALMTGRITPDIIDSVINYHPQSGWFEDAPLKGGAVIAGPLRGHCCRKPYSEGTVIACPPRGRCYRRPSLRALLQEAPRRGLRAYLDPPHEWTCLTSVV